MVALSPPLPRPASRRSPARRGLASLVAAVALWIPAATAAAQISDVEPFYAATSAEGALLRSHPTSAHYPVAKLPAGRVLRVDGQNQEWARVLYPPGVPAFLPADAAEVDSASMTATTTQPTQLKAFNMNTGLPGSWKPLLAEPLPPGTRLTLIDLDQADDTRGGFAYRVVPPPEARAYIQRSLLRPATPEEVAAYEAQLKAAIAPDQPAEAEVAEAPAPVTEAPPQAAAPAPAPVESLAEPMVPPTQGQAPMALTPGQPTPGPAPAGDVTPPQAVAGEAAPAEATLLETLIDQSRRAPGEVAAEDGPMEPRPATPEELEAAYLAVTKQPAAEAEFGELMAEYERTIASLDDSPYNQRLKARLNQRLELLRIRRDLQEQWRRLEEAKAETREDAERLARRMAEVARTRHYTIVGRLSASALYDGKRLPLMYRIQSSGGAARTLGYIRPEPGMRLESKLGQIVGIVGEPSIDPALRLNVINAQRVEVLEPATAAVVEPAAD